jgi:hypothetical protein
MDIKNKIQNSFENAPKNTKNQQSIIRVWCFLACFTRFMCSITLKLLPFATESCGATKMAATTYNLFVINKSEGTRLDSSTIRRSPAIQLTM